MKQITYSVVIPSYNEEQNLIPLLERLVPVMDGLGDYEIIFIDDGSSDKTLEILKNLHNGNHRLKFISLSRNFGHQPALKAGLDHAAGEAIICMDGDLQHPPELIPELITEWKNGHDVVFTLRLEDKNLSFFKRKTSGIFYRLINGLSDTKVEPGAADFRLMDRKVVDVFKSLPENPQFIRGLVPWLGFRQLAISYKPESRLHGESKYTVRKMFRFALNGITSFSVKPLHLSTVMGFITCGLAFAYGLYAILVHLFTEVTVPGWTSVLVSVLFIGGIQFFILGIMGEYLGKLFMQSKDRPHYIIREMSE